jgi:phage terminase large subunit GpA-like protein
MERDAEWFAQLTSEIVRTKYAKGRPVREWTPRREGAKTEALDCRVYAFAALRGLVRNWKFDLNKAVENLQKIPLKNSNKQYQQVIQNNNTRRVRKVRSRGII